MIDNGSLVIGRGRSIPLSLLEVFGFEEKILGQDRGTVGISRKKFENAADGDPHPADAGLPAAFAWPDRDPIEKITVAICSV